MKARRRAAGGRTNISAALFMTASLSAATPGSRSRTSHRRHLSCPGHALGAALVLAYALMTSGHLQAQAPGSLSPPRPTGWFWRPAGGVLAWNAVAWGINRYVKNEPRSRVGPESWWRNLQSGFRWDDWDDDGFLTNQQCHPWRDRDRRGHPPARPPGWCGALAIEGHGPWTRPPPFSSVPPPWASGGRARTAVPL